MNEKMYKTLANAGKISLVVGIVTIVVSVIGGVLGIVVGAKLLNKKKEVLF